MRNPILIDGMSPRDYEALRDPSREGWLHRALGQLHNPGRAYRLYAVWCARRAQGPIKSPDPRVLAICNVVERFALGRATEEQA